MLVAELRYTGAFLWLAGTIVVGFWAAVVFGRAEHLSLAETVGVFVTLAVLGCAALIPFAIGSPAAVAPSVRARFAPLAVAIAFVAFQIIAVVREVAAHASVRDWQSIAVSVFVTIAFALASIPDLRARFGTGVAATPRPNERLARIAAAYAMRPGPARDSALRFFRISGLVRFALIAVLIVGTIVLMPAVGPMLAFLITFSLFAVVFITLHRVYDI